MSSISSESDTWDIGDHNFGWYFQEGKYGHLCDQEYQALGTRPLATLLYILRRLTYCDLGCGLTLLILRRINAKCTSRRAS
jgi:hypothetical protein